jgi:hypothetical protein
MPPAARCGKSANNQATKDSLAPDILNLTLCEQSLARHTLLATTSGQSGINSDLNAHTLAAAVIVEA